MIVTHWFNTQTMSRPGNTHVFQDWLNSHPGTPFAVFPWPANTMVMCAIYIEEDPPR